MNNDAVNIHVQVFEWIFTFILHGYIPMSELLGPVVNFVLIFNKPPNCLPKGYTISHFHWQIYEGTNF